jgi:glycosyltransferase involved in cell wall biosynthesis
VRAGGRALVLAETGRLAGRLAAAGGEHVTFPAASKNPVRMLANAGALARLIARHGVDLVHARSRAPAWSGLIAARRSRVAFVTTYHGAYGETNAAKRVYNSVMARGDVVIANSRYTAELIVRRYGTSRAQIVSIHRGVDVHRFDPDQVAPERLVALRRSWGIGAGRPIILQAARLTAWKGQGVLIDAARLLHATGRLAGARIILAGDAQGRHGYNQWLQRKIEADGLTATVRLVGHVEDMAATYLAAHVTVVGSIEPEAFGRAAIEAAAMQCPVIASDLGAPPETILAPPAAAASAATGWLVAPGDAAALADRLSEALALTEAARAEIGGRARRHVLAHFTLAAMQRRTLAVYDRLLGSALERRFVEAEARGPGDQPRATILT